MMFCDLVGWTSMAAKLDAASAAPSEHFPEAQPVQSILPEVELCVAGHPHWPAAFAEHAISQLALRRRGLSAAFVSSTPAPPVIGSSISR